MRSLPIIAFNSYYFSYVDNPLFKHFSIKMSIPVSHTIHITRANRCNHRYGNNSSDLPPCSFVPISDGRTPHTVMISPGLTRNPDEVFTYVVSHFGQWVEVNAQEGPQYTALGFQVFTVDTTVTVTDWTKPQPAPSTENVFTGQYEEIGRAESELVRF